MANYASQFAFSGGELAEESWGRVDLDKYHIGLAIARNWVVRPHGGARNRAGFEFLSEAAGHTSRPRMITFAFNTSQQYALEFGNYTIKVFKDGAVVTDPSTGIPVSVASPFTSAQAWGLDYAQTADVMTLVHKDIGIRELTRTDHHLWSISTPTLGASISAPTGVGVAVDGAGTTYQYVVTAVDDETGEESVASSSASGDGDLTVAGNEATATWNAVSGADRYNVYKRRGGVWAFVGSADSLSFTDDNILADMLDTPPINRDPFSADSPGAVGLFEQRRLFGQTNSVPDGNWTSQTGLHSNFNRSFPRKADDAITFKLNSSQSDEVRFYVPLEDLMILTAGGEWKSTSGDSAFTSENLRNRPQTGNGTSNVKPVVVNDTIVYNQEEGNYMMDLLYKLEVDKYSGGDLTVLSRHLFEGHSIVDMCYAKSPDSVVWAVRSDGVLLGLTFRPEHKVWAWHKHTTDGTFESVCSVKEGGSTFLYAAIKRTVNGEDKYYIERQKQRTYTTIEDSFFVDSGLTYSGEATATFGGLGHLEGKQVAILGDGSVYAPQQVVSGQVTISKAVTKCHIGLAIPEVDIQTLPLTIGEGEGIAAVKSVSAVKVRVKDSRGLWVGPSKDKQKEWHQRRTEGYNTPIQPFSGLKRFPITSGWGEDAALVISQRDPLPAEILSVFPEVAVGG